MLIDAFIPKSHHKLKHIPLAKPKFTIPEKIDTSKKNQSQLFGQSNRSMNAAYKNLARRKNVQLPLFIQPFQTNDDDNTVILPLPSSHLPVELSTMNLYTLTVLSPAHKLMLQEAQSNTANSASRTSFMGQSVGVYGHVIANNPYVKSLENNDNNDESDLVGLIGCAAEILIAASPIQDVNEDRSLEDEQPVQVLTRGSFRFVIKEIVSTIPFPIAIVDELCDNDNNDDSHEAENIINAVAPIEYNDFEDDDYNEDDDYDEDDEYGELNLYQTLPASELNSRTLQAMEAYIQLRMSTDPTQAIPSSPLEEEILKIAGMSPGDTGNNPTRATTDEMAAIFSVLRQELVEINSIEERRFTISFLAAEMTSPPLTNAQRLQILSTQNSIHRMRLILQRLETNISMERAKNMANELTKDADRKEGFGDNDFVPEGGQDLKVGDSGLPKWADQLTKGMRIEYFWNEEYGWCEGIIEEKVKVFDEIIVTVRFIDDGEVYKLPVTSDEKIRWRPAQS